jgi:CTP synthase
MQIAVIDFARNVLGKEKANSTEFDPDTPDPVIHIMDEQKSVTEKGATMRLGACPCRLRPGSFSRIAYDKEEVSERHRHRFEFNNSYREQMESAGLIVAGT